MFHPLALLSILATQSDDAAAAAAFSVMSLIGMVFCGMFLFFIAIHAFICWYLSSCLKALPPEHRKQQPGMVWLLMIPFVPLVWNFFVYPKIADSFKSYFDSIGRTDLADCGRGLGITYSILFCCLLLPYLNACAVFVVLVMLILVLVKFSSLKGQVLASRPA